MSGINIPIHYIIGFVVVALVGYFVWRQSSKVNGLEKDVSNLVGMISRVPTEQYEDQDSAQGRAVPNQQPMPRGNRAQQVQVATGGSNEQESALAAMQAQYGDDTLNEMFS